MAKEQTSLSNFQFDDENVDWDFGGEENQIDTSKVVKSVQGSTIDNADDGDDDEPPVKIEEEGVELDKPAEVEIPEKKKTTTKKLEPSKEKDTTKKKVKDDSEEEDDEDDLDISFEEEDEQSETTKVKKESSKPVEEEPVDDTKFYNTLSEELSEKGIFKNVEIPKDKVLTEDEFFEMMEEEVDVRASEIIEVIGEKAGEDGKAYLKHLKKGGTTKDFVETYYGSGIDYDKFDVEDDTQREALLKFYLKSVDGKDEDEAVAYIEFLKEGGKDKTTATKYANKLKKDDEQARADLDKVTEEKRKTTEENNKKFNIELLETINKVDRVGVIPINKVDQKELPSYMTKPTVKVKKNTYIPKFHEDLAKIVKGKTKEDRQKLVLLAKLIKNDFDISDIVPKIETRVATGARNRLQTAKAGGVRSSGSATKRALADMFEDDE